ncbi:uncharacterized protein [Physcomitrium patens]|uniref:Uncharacterized protein n=1 Tax=Physcomitrium patens TaxID=3218 RepID=A0A2K1KSS6_PHYPA|nr:hypothetical protein PHYPA_003803 [Physcomitrium patens]
MHVDLAVSQHPVPLVTGHHQLHPLPTRSYMLFAGFVWASLPGQSPGIINGLNFRNVGCLVLLLCIRQADLTQLTKAQLLLELADSTLFCSGSAWWSAPSQLVFLGFL